MKLIIKTSLLPNKNACILNTPLLRLIASATPDEARPQLNINKGHVFIVKKTV